MYMYLGLGPQIFRALGGRTPCPPTRAGPNNDLHGGEQRSRLRGTTIYMERNNNLHGEEQRPRLRRTTTYTEREKKK
jgi:hypothetical protein